MPPFTQSLAHYITSTTSAVVTTHIMFISYRLWELYNNLSVLHTCSMYIHVDYVTVFMCTQYAVVMVLLWLLIQVYLQFAVVSLLASLVSPSGRLEDSAVLPALVGVTAVQTMRTGTAARLLQYLLTSPPGMETTAGMHSHTLTLSVISQSLLPPSSSYPHSSLPHSLTCSPLIHSLNHFLSLFLPPPPSPSFPPSLPPSLPPSHPPSFTYLQSLLLPAVVLVRERLSRNCGSPSDKVLGKPQVTEKMWKFVTLSPCVSPPASLSLNLCPPSLCLPPLYLCPPSLSLSPSPSPPPPPPLPLPLPPSSLTLFPQSSLWLSSRPILSSLWCQRLPRSLPAVFSPILPRSHWNPLHTTQWWWVGKC